MKRVAVACAALVLVIAAYSNFFHNAFHFDDSHVIVENASIHTLQNWPRFFTDAHTFSSLPTNATYRPLVTLSFALDYAVHHALDPLGFTADAATVYRDAVEADPSFERARNNLRALGAS